MSLLHFVLYIDVTTQLYLTNAQECVRTNILNISKFHKNTMKMKINTKKRDFYENHEHQN